MPGLEQALSKALGVLFLGRNDSCEKSRRWDCYANDDETVKNMAILYKVLVADPPWQFSDTLGKRGAGSQYSCLTLEQIEGFHLPPMEKDSYLFLWRVSSQVQEAYRVVDAWGFVPKTEIVWVKRTKNNKRHFGMGRHLRAEHETCIVATRGSPKPKVRNIRSVFEAKVGAHSQKPDEFYEIVEAFSEGPYAELFARRFRRGWFCMGMAS